MERSFAELCQICLVYRGVNFMTPEAAEELYSASILYVYMYINI